MGLWNVNILHLKLQDFARFWAQLCGLGRLRSNFQTHLGLKHNSPFYFFFPFSFYYIFL